MFLLQLRFHIYNVLNEKMNLYFYMVWFVHVLWLVEQAVFDGSSQY